VPHADLAPIAEALEKIYAGADRRLIDVMLLFHASDLCVPSPFVPCASLTPLSVRERAVGRVAAWLHAPTLDTLRALCSPPAALRDQWASLPAPSPDADVTSALHLLRIVQNESLDCALRCAAADQLHILCAGTCRTQSS
jgi:hypothetical protein